MFLLLMFILTVVFPAAFWWYFFIWQDRAEPEPKKLLVKMFFIGVGVAFLAAAFEEMISFALFPDSGDNILETVKQLTLAGASSLIIASIVEELVKFLAIREFVYLKNSFNQVADGVFYAVAIAIGFVVVENSTYFYLLYAEETAIVFVFSTMIRGIATALMHITSAGIIGYSFGKMKFTAGHSRKIVFKALLFAMALHIVFNILVSFEMITIAFLITFITFLYLLKALRKRESSLVWKLITPAKPAGKSRS